MSYDRNKVIRIASAEVGYLEKSKTAYTANPAILDENTAGAGYDNYTKYGRDMHKLYPSVMDFPAAWCDAFVDWCFYKAYGVATAKSLLGGNFDDYTVASARMFKNKGVLDKIPEVGAQIFFTRNGGYSGCYHTGIVVAVSADKKTVTTIEGNTSASGSSIEANGGAVCRKTRTVNSNTLFGHPAYGGSEKIMSTYTGTVKVNSNLSVRTGPGTSYSKAECFPGGLLNGTKLTIDKEQNGFGRLIGTTYWVSTEYVIK